MKRLMFFSLVVVLVVSLSGCAELKQLRIDNASLKTQVDQLDKDKQACQNKLSTQQTKLKETQIQVKQQSDAFNQMQDAMKNELASKQVAIKELEGKLTLTMVESILFDSGKAVVKKEGIEALKKVAEVLNNTKGQDIIVAGYTDNVPIGGKLALKYPTNWELSCDRAISVLKILTANGVDPKMLCATGFGEFRPIAENDTAEGRAKNRRMEIILMPKRQ